MKIVPEFLVVWARRSLACDVFASTFQYGSYSVTNEQNISISTPNVSGGAGQIKLIGAGLTPRRQFWLGAYIYDFLQNSSTYL